MSFKASKQLEAAQKEHNNNYVDIYIVVCFRRNLKPFGQSVKNIFLDYVETISNNVPSTVLTKNRYDLDHLIFSTDCN